jgi:ankyrin repeat protein
VTSDFRPPHSSSVFTATATAIRAIRLYLPEEARGEGDAAIGRARSWLARTRPVSTEDASFRLLGLVWAEAAPANRDAAARDLEKMALPAGGWAELPGYPADAYSTGEALFALHEAGRQMGNAWRKGMQFLLTTQASDGSWRVRTRMLSPAQVSPDYFTTGFPYQKDEYISYAGSCWAVLALLEALPQAAPLHKDVLSVETEPTWMRAALFGTASQLRAELDQGLDPNRKTENGTTLLMMAAPDAEKVRVLLARGADAKARAKSGCDALTIAAAYRGSADAVQTLLNAGAEPLPGAGVRTRNTPLQFAALTGDLENVKLLLAQGAKPSAAALSSAVTFGYADVVRTLIAAGASVDGTEATGINLLHWAAITNRAAVVPILVQAGAALNATDENGYTPLMYAATIDFGDADVLRALLHAGADRKIRNADGRTPAEQARHYRHSQLEAALQ